MTAVAAAAAALASSRDAPASEAALRALLTATKQPGGWAPNDVLACPSALPALVEQLSAVANTPRPQLAAQSLVLLVAMTTANEKRVIGAAGALQPLVRLLSSATSGADAAKALWVLCWDCKEHQRPVAALGALPRLVAHLHTSDEDGQRCAAGAIERICLNDASLRVAAARAGAIAPLVRLLGDGRTLRSTVCGIRGTRHDFTGRIAHALWALVQDDALAAEDARDAGAVAPLVKLLALSEEADSTAVKGAAGALLALSGTAATHAQLRAAGAVVAALRCAGATSRADTRLLCLLLAACLHTGAGDVGDVDAALAAFDCSAHLVALLRVTLHGDGRHEECVWSVTQASHHVAVAAVAERTAERLVASGAVPLLVELLSSSRAADAPARLDAATALLRMSYVPRLAPELRAAGAAAAAALHAGSEDERLADAARGLLRHLDGAAPTPASAHDVDDMSRFDVFVSHKRSDAKDFARALHTMLTGMGLRVFLDVECLEDIHDLRTLVARSDNVIFVLTDNVLDSAWCIAELEAAALAGINVVLVKMNGARWRDSTGAPVLEFPDERMLGLLPPAVRPLFSRTAVDHSDAYYAAFKTKLCERLRDRTNNRLVLDDTAARPGSVAATVGSSAVAAELRALCEEVAAMRTAFEASGVALPGGSKRARSEQ